MVVFHGVYIYLNTMKYNNLYVYKYASLSLRLVASMLSSK